MSSTAQESTPPTPGKPHVDSPLAGAYHWVPRPTAGGISWDLLTCHDLDAWQAISHRELWPLILEVMAKNWNQDLRILNNLLYDHHAGLPRGRITHGKLGYLVIHGDDAPVGNWLEPVKVRFRLTAVELSAEYTEHEEMLAKDLKAVQAALGIALSLRTKA